MPLLNWIVDDSNIQRAIYKLTDPLTGLISASASLALAGRFTVLAKGISLLATPFLDYQAQTQLNDRIGREMTQMNHSLKIMAESSQSNANLQHQLTFHQHVHDYVSMRTQQLAQLGDGCDHHIFVYSYGTEWHPAFYALCKKEPLANFFGMFDDLAMLLTFLEILRIKNLVRATAVFHILMPTTSLTYFPSTISHLDSISPIVFEGEKHSNTGKPYVYLQTINSTPDMFSNVTNLEIAAPNISDAPDTKMDPPQSNEHRSFWRRKITSTAAGMAVGGPVGFAGYAAGAAVVMATGGAAALSVPIYAATALAFGIGAGVKSGRATTQKAEEVWDSLAGNVKDVK